MQPAPPRYDPPVREIRRIVFTSLAALSLILCVATVGLWVRSYFGYENLRWRSSRGNASFALHGEWGRVAVTWGAWSFGKPRPGWSYRSAAATHPFEPPVLFERYKIDKPFMADTSAVSL